MAKIFDLLFAGVENGQVIKITGYGAAGSGGGPKGDLYITFTTITLLLNEIKRTFMLVWIRLYIKAIWEVILP
jgi:hypothetical protein